MSAIKRLTQFSKPTNGQAVCGLKRKLDGLVLLHELNFSGINLDLILKKGIIEV